MPIQGALRVRQKSSTSIKGCAACSQLTRVRAVRLQRKADRNSVFLNCSRLQLHVFRLYTAMVTPLSASLIHTYITTCATRVVISSYCSRKRHNTGASKYVQLENRSCRTMTMLAILCILSLYDCVEEG